MNLSPGSIIAGKFQLERELGRGGMGAVWAAAHLSLGIPIAIKFMDPEHLDSEEARRRFETEARAAAQLRSPHVVQVLEHGVDGTTPFIVMERLDGEDLEARLTRRYRLPLIEVSTIVTQAAKALRRAQDMGIIHRDLKPSNVFLAHIDYEEVVKLLDFGVAKTLLASPFDQRTQHTRQGVLVGSPAYMSPEQLHDPARIDARSDLWSLAVILFRAVTGRMPFVGDSIAELIVKICRDPIPTATEVAPDLPPILNDFFARAFARQPDDRFQTATELAMAFATIATGVHESAWTAGTYGTAPLLDRRIAPALPPVPGAMPMQTHMQAPGSPPGGMSTLGGGSTPPPSIVLVPWSVATGAAPAYRPRRSLFGWIAILIGIAVIVAGLFVFLRKVQREAGDLFDAPPKSYRP